MTQHTVALRAGAEIHVVRGQQGGQGDDERTMITLTAGGEQGKTVVLDERQREKLLEVLS